MTNYRPLFTRSNDLQREHASSPQGQFEVVVCSEQQAWPPFRHRSVETKKSHFAHEDLQWRENDLSGTHLFVLKERLQFSHFWVEILKKGVPKVNKPDSIRFKETQHGYFGHSSCLCWNGRQTYLFKIRMALGSEELFVRTAGAWQRFHSWFARNYVLSVVCPHRVQCRAQQIRGLRSWSQPRSSKGRFVHCVYLCTTRGYPCLCR